MIELYVQNQARPLRPGFCEIIGLQNRPKVIVGKVVTVRIPAAEPSYFTDLHRRWIGASGTVHAIVNAQPRDNPLIKVKFGDEQQVVFFRLSDLDLPL